MVKPFTGVKFLYFDIGYTLVNEERVWQRRCKEQAESREARELGLTAEDIFREIIHASENYLPQYRTVASKYGFKEVAPYRCELEFAYPQAEALLDKLSRKYKLGVIANQTDGLQKRLAHFGLDRYFTVIISSWDYGIMKPNPELFRIGVEKSGYKAEQLVMIGDRLDNDIFPAKTVGMKTIWVKQGFGGLQKPKSAQYEPTAAVDRLDELLDIL